MSPLATLVVLGLVNWFATLLVVESELVRPLRDWLDGRRRSAEGWSVEYDCAGNYMHGTITCPWRCRAWGKIGYLFHCHMCAGTWVGLAIAAVAGGPFTGWAALVLNGLAYKAVGHLTLAVVNRLDQR